MLHEFLTANRDEIIARARKRVAARTAPQATELELANGVPVFIDQLGDALRVAVRNGKIDHEAITASAARHGHDLLALGLTVAQVVHDYGDVCQVVTGLAAEQSADITPAEFRTLNLCLDDAIAHAVTEYGRERDVTRANEEVERMGSFSHELRNLVSIALLSFETIKQGLVGAGGSTAALHGRSLTRLRDLIDRTLADVRLEAGVPRLRRVSVASFIEEMEIGAAIEARTKGVQLSVTRVDPNLYVDADPQTLGSAVSNLLQNAFKYTAPAGHVVLTARAEGERVLIEVADECGGLPPGKAEELFQPFEQRSSDRSGLGLGLAISAKAAKANGAEIRVRDVPGKGCVFTLDLPRKPPPPTATASSPAP